MNRQRLFAERDIVVGQTVKRRGVDVVVEMHEQFCLAVFLLPKDRGMHAARCFDFDGGSAVGRPTNRVRQQHSLIGIRIAVVRMIEPGGEVDDSALATDDFNCAASFSME